MSPTSPASNLLDFSTLAAKPPQRPIENLPTRKSTSNYASALASAAEEHKQPQSTTHSKPPNLNLEATTEQAQNATASPSSAVSWQPRLDRQQSWNAQDHRRAMQSPLMTPKLERGQQDYGFSSNETDGQTERK